MVTGFFCGLRSLARLLIAVLIAGTGIAAGFRAWVPVCILAGVVVAAGVAYAMFLSGVRPPRQHRRAGQ
jgi:hypothetical protein